MYGFLRNGERTRQKRFNIHTHTVKTSEEGKNADLKKEIGPGNFLSFFLSLMKGAREGRKQKRKKQIH